MEQLKFELLRSFGFDPQQLYPIELVLFLFLACRVLCRAVCAVRACAVSCMPCATTRNNARLLEEKNLQSLE